MAASTRAGHRTAPRCARTPERRALTPASALPNVGGIALQLFQRPSVRPARSLADDLRDLHRLAWEGLYREDEVRELLRAVHDDEPLDEVARESGKLVSRYCAMRRELGRIEAPELQPHVCALSEIFDYLAQLLHYAVALLGTSWRSEALREQQRLVGPIGPQGERLRRVVAEIDRLAKSGAGEPR
jgi:hypothetical protein